MRIAENYYRLAVAVGLGTVLLLVWMIGALGVIGPGGRPDLMYAGVLAVGLVGAVIARLRPRGMAWTLVAMAVAQVVVAVIALLAGLQHTAGASVAEILGLTGMYVVLFGVSAWLFLRAAGQRLTQVVRDHG
jgi:hypothetical protein